VATRIERSVPSLASWLWQYANAREHAVAIRRLLVDTADQVGNCISPVLFTALLVDACVARHDLAPAWSAAGGLCSSRIRRAEHDERHLGPVDDDLTPRDFNR
jgi:hypothetical protein